MILSLVNLFACPEYWIYFCIKKSKLKRSVDKLNDAKEYAAMKRLDASDYDLSNPATSRFAVRREYQEHMNDIKNKVGKNGKHQVETFTNDVGGSSLNQGKYLPRDNGIGIPRMYGTTSANPYDNYYQGMNYSPERQQEYANFAESDLNKSKYVEKERTHYAKSYLENPNVQTSIYNGKPITMFGNEMNNNSYIYSQNLSPRNHSYQPVYGQRTVELANRTGDNPFVEKNNNQI